MDLRQLRYFVAVAEERHFRRAAERLHMSQPPLSQHIAALEEELGTMLLQRDRRSVRLTTAGETFLRRARALLDQASSAAREARRIGRGEMGRLSIGFMSAAMLSRFPSILRKFRDTNPGADVDLVQLSPKGQIEAVACGQIDIGFLAIAQADTLLHVEGAELQTATVWEEELVAALPSDHRLANQPTISLRTLASEVFITLPRAPETGHYDQVTYLCEKKGGFRANIGREVEQLPIALTLVATGHGVSLIPSCAIGDWQGLVAFPRLKERPRIPVTIVWRGDNSSPVLQAFRQIVPGRKPLPFFAATVLSRT
jgi:DNA-binding transcriptional LysR family regulator